MMVLQCFSDITLIRESGTSLHGPGEKLDLPLNEAVKVMNEASKHFKIIAPLPLLPGVVVCWSLPGGCVEGPGTVLTVEGTAPHRMLSVTNDERICLLEEADLVDINPWPLIDSMLEEGVDRLIVEGEESPKLLAIREWLSTHFDEDRDQWTG